MSEALHLHAPPLAVPGRPAGASARTGRLTNLQLLRGAAAAIVALMHAGILLGWIRGDQSFAWLFTPRSGVIGVALFFAISGYLMAQLVRQTDPATFLIHRLVRIYPIFLVITVLAYPAQVLTGADMRFDWMALTLAPAGSQFYVLGTEWTLLHEMTFYVALTGIAWLGFGRRIEWVALAWLLVMAGISLAGSPLARETGAPQIHTILFASANVAFAAGLLVPAALARNLLPPALCLAAIPASLVMIRVDTPQPWWLFGLTSVLSVAALVQIRQIGTGGVIRSALVRFGDWSYVLYLVHMPLFVVVYRSAPASIPPAALLAGALGALLATTAALGHLDIRLHRRLRRWADGLSAGTRRRVALGFLVLFAGVSGTAMVQHVIREAEAGRVRLSLGRLPAGSFAGEAALRAAIAEAGLAGPASFVGEVESIRFLPTGQVLVLGWAIDLDRPTSATHLVAACGGRVVAIAQPRRIRADIARRLGRADLGRTRFGFMPMVEAGACRPDEPVVTLFADGEARLLAPAAAKAP